ncbi:hypothetical protein [Pelagicoccus mobilis]|uniref:Uncharacterized protein n=1 Tax=Pelagicoccus mobilis TaxID=415221 RepID=A0A934S0D4_9BACT|nr:hypothetical protein [Pelagicoccus mobilis]MBK1877149.1 hypothetical protein [Pelagicoccus mobilis]
MPLILLKFAKWFLGKGIVWATVAALAIGVFALWIFVKRSYSDEGERVAELSQLQERASVVYAELETSHKRLIELGEEIESARRNIEALERAIEFRDGILKSIERLFTMSSEERAEVEAELEQAKADRLTEIERRKKLTSEQSQERIDRIAFSDEARGLEGRISELEGESSRFVEHLEEAWVRMKPYLVVALASAILLPVLWKLFAFYLWAPVLAIAGPIRLWKETLPLPELSEAGVSASVNLEKGQKLWVKESYLQASDECLSKQTRFVLDWSIPATCLAAGLTEMVEFSGMDGNAGNVTVSPQRRAELEVAIVEIPEGGKMVIRPSSVAGLISRSGERVKITRRWRLFHPQAWLSFQFRYFIFEGASAVVVSGVRGVRFEEMNTGSEQGRRSNQIATIGFTPDLGYGVVRAETFWSYFRGFNPLFDDVFRGKGAFICQEITEEEANQASRFWRGLWSGVLKVLGV